MSTRLSKHMADVEHHRREPDVTPPDAVGPEAGTGERRTAERRKRRNRRFLERRTGFDRRTGGQTVSEEFLHTIRSSDYTVLLLLLLINVLNFADYAFTRILLQQGFREANPLFALLLAKDPAYAGYLKIVTVLAFSVVAWGFRRYKLVLALMLVVAAVFLVLLVYHVRLVYS